MSEKFENLDLSQIGGTVTGSGSNGVNNVLGGYSAIVESVDMSTVILRESNDLDMSKFVAGLSVTFTGIQNEDLENNEFGNLAKVTISSVDETSRTLYFDEDVSSYTSENSIVRILDDSNFNSRNAIGDFNLVVGGASVALGKRNAIHGFNSLAAGIYNTVLTDSSFTIGMNNTALSGSSIYTFGISNKINDNAFVIGLGNETKNGQQGSIIIGNTNREISCVNGVVIGTGNTVAGNNSITLGFRITNNQEQGIAIGESITENTLENKKAVFINGHSYKVKRIDPLDEYSTFSCYRHEYKGTSKPVMQEITIENTTPVIIDIDQYSRFSLIGHGTANIEFINMQNGDSWELFLNTNEISLITDENIVGGESIYSAEPGKHLIKFMYMYDIIYTKIEF